MRHLTTRFSGQLANVLHDLVGLLDWVLAVEIDGVIKILRVLSPHPDCFVPVRDDRLTQIIVQCLLWIGVAGVKGVNACVCAISVSLSHVDFFHQILREIIVRPLQMA